MAQVLLHSIFVLLICKCVLADDDLQRNPFIVGGTPATIGQFPYMASLRSNGRHFCGGSIVNKYWILTAAHCVVDIKTFEDIDVAVGTNSLTTGGTVVKVEKVLLYNYINFLNILIKNDIALVKLATPITFTDLIKPVTICSSQPPSGTLGYIAGWGLTNSNDHVLPDNLLYITANTVSWFSCFFSNFPSILWCRYICAKATPSDNGICFGDSGGPLVVSNEQIGVLSWTKSCGVGKPDAYVDVCKFKNWIEQNIA